MCCLLIYLSLVTLVCAAYSNLNFSCAWQDGLVIIDARYGELDAIMQDEQQRIDRLNDSREVSSSSQQAPAASAASRWQGANALFVRA